MKWLLGKRKQRLSRDLLDAVLLDWAPGAPWTVRDAFQGVQVFGSTGAGKSSGAIALLSRCFLSAGFGGVYFTVKPEDRTSYERQVRECGRQEDLLVFGPESGLRFNFIAAEKEHGKDAVGLAENLTALIMTVAELSDRSRGQRGGGSENSEYFRQSALRLARNAMLVLVLSGEELTVTNLYRLVISAPKSRQEVQDEGCQKESFCF